MTTDFLTRLCILLGLDETLAGNVEASQALILQELARHPVYSKLTTVQLSLAMSRVGIGPKPEDDGAGLIAACAALSAERQQNEDGGLVRACAALSNKQ